MISDGRGGGDGEDWAGQGIGSERRRAKREGKGKRGWWLVGTSTDGSGVVAVGGERGVCDGIWRALGVYVYS